MTEKEKPFSEKIFANKDLLLTILKKKEAIALDKQDRKAEQQVWQRVLGSREEGTGQQLRQLQREAMELAAVYRSLAAQLTGHHREQVQQLYRAEKANAAALAGIGLLSRQGGEALKLWQPGKEPVAKVLERCYHRTRHCIAEYMARSADGEYGSVFRYLADREAAHCAVIAELLGSLGQNRYDRG